MKKDEYTDHLAVAHPGRSLGFLTQNEVFSVLFKILAEFIDNTENISNFVVINHSGKI